MLVAAKLILGAWLLGQPSIPDAAAARRAEKAGDFAGAEAIYAQLVSTHADAATYERLGLVRHMQSKYEGAAEAFRKAVKLDASLWTSHLFLGIDLYRLNRFDEAAGELAVSNRLHPGEQETLFWMGATALARHDSISGFEQLEKFLQRDPGNAEVLQMLAEAYGEYGTAMLNEVGDKYPDSAAGLLVQAKAFEFEGAYAAAAEAYRAVLRLEPDRPGMREAAARVELLQKGAAPN